MNRNHLQHLLFMLVVLFAVVFGGAPDSKSEPKLDPAPVKFTAPIVKQESADNLTANLLPPPVLRPEISAASALVKDLFATGPIFDFQPNKQWSTASLAKLMTAVVALDKIPAGSKILMSYKAVTTEGAAGNFIIGQVYDRDDLLKALLVYSSNDAAAALAEYYNTRPERFELNPNDPNANFFVEEMNTKAASLGMYNTRYFDSHGLSPLNQSTANDLEKLIHHIFNIRPEIFVWSRIRDGNTHPFVEWDNYVGGKTGFLDEASGNLITVFNNRGRVMVIIVLGSEDRAKDTEALYSVYKENQ